MDTEQASSVSVSEEQGKRPNGGARVEGPSGGPYLLRVFLADRSAECPGCKYDLRGLTGNHCPECNQELELRVGLVEPKMRLWVTGLVALAAGVGFSGLLFAYGVIMTIGARGAPGPGSFFVLTLGGLFIEGVLLVSWVRGGKRIRLMALDQRVWLVIGCFVVTALNLVLFTKFIR